MSEREFFDILVYVWIGVAAVTVPYLMFVAAPYGRHLRPGWGPTLNPRLGWVVMEAPALLLPLLFFISSGRYTAVNSVFLCMWLLHYVNRTLVFPFRMRAGARMPLAICASGFFFNLVNGYMQGRWIFHFGPSRPDSWFSNPLFLIGLAFFVAGFYLNLQSDAILRGLRKPGETGYRIPHGGLFRWVSCPNYLSELVEWCGWAVATWSISGGVFVFWTAANLAPRALKNHQWYRKTFPEYPGNRKALLPYIM